MPFQNRIVVSSYGSDMDDVKLLQRCETVVTALVPQVLLQPAVPNKVSILATTAPRMRAEKYINIKYRVIKQLFLIHLMCAQSAVSLSCI